MAHKQSLMMILLIMAVCGMAATRAAAVTTAIATPVWDYLPYDNMEPDPYEEVPFGDVYHWATFRVQVSQGEERYLFTVSESIQNVVGPAASWKEYNAAPGTDELYSTRNGQGGAYYVSQSGDQPGNRLHLAQVIGRPEGNYMGMLIGATTYWWNWKQ